MASHYPQDGHPPSHGWSLTIQNLPETLYYKLGIWLLDLTHKIKTRWQLLWMVSHHHQDGHPPPKGWLSTIQNLTEGSVLQTQNLAHRLNNKIKTWWQLPWMVGYHPLNGHPPSQRQGWSPSIPRMVTYQPLVSQPLSKITLPNIVTELPKDGHPQSQAWSPTIQNY